MNIYVGNLPFAVSENDIEQIFSGFGAVESVKIIRDRDSGRSKGFGFVIMNNDNEAHSAINALNGKDLKGRNLIVNEARPRENTGGMGGGFRQGGSNRRGTFARDRY